jgi:hypothetical protein
MEANPFFLMIYFYLVHRVHMLQLIMSEIRHFTLTFCLSNSTQANYLQPDLLALSLFSKMLQWGYLS